MTFDTRGGNVRYVLRDREGNEYTTFRESIGSEAQRLEGKRVRIEYHENQRGQYTNVYLDKVEPAPEEPDAAAGGPDTDPDEAAWRTAVDAAPWLVGESEPHEEVAPDELYDKLKPFKQRALRRTSRRPNPRTKTWTSRPPGAGVACPSNGRARPRHPARPGCHGVGCVRDRQRRHGAERGAAGHRERLRLRRDHRPVGDQRLRADLRCADRDRRASGRHVRTQRLFFIGAAIFALFSVLGGAAQDEVWLIVCRALMGIGGAIMWPAALGMTYDVLPEDKAGLAGG